MSKLAILRKAAGLTQQALANKADTNIRQIQKLEAEETSMERVQLRNALSIADALGVDARDLLE